jgi:hypothetical protein
MAQVHQLFNVLFNQRICNQFSQKTKASSEQSANCFQITDTTSSQFSLIHRSFPLVQLPNHRMITSQLGNIWIKSQNLSEINPNP